MKLLELCTIAAAAVAPLLAGCEATAKAHAQDASIPPLPHYDGPKARILIEDFVWGVQGQGGGVEYAIEGPDGTVQRTSWSVQPTQAVAGLQQSLKMSLQESKRFLCTDRAALAALKQELELGQEGFIDASAALEKGHVKSPDLLVRATITEWDDHSGGSSAGGGGLFDFPIASGIG